MAHSSENVNDQLESLKDAVSGGSNDVQLIYADEPVVLDHATLCSGMAFPNLSCVAKDRLHVALKEEQVFEGKTTQFSLRVRRRMRKFAVPYDGGQPYFRNWDDTPDTIDLSKVAVAMAHTAAARIIMHIDKEAYPKLPYRQASQFVRDVAAITIEHKDVMKRRTGNDTTVLVPIAFACQGLDLEYFMNAPRSMARNPGTAGMSGTTFCEAVHAEQKTFFEGVAQQSAGRASVFVDLCFLKKLVTGTMQQQALHKVHSLVELLRLMSGVVSSVVFPQALPTVMKKALCPTEP